MSLHTTPLDVTPHNRHSSVDPGLAQEADWAAAVAPDGTAQDGAWVTELTELIELADRPEHTRVIARRERPHPGAQLSLFDQHEGFRHQVFITGSNSY